MSTHEREPENQLLAALPPSELALLQPHLKPVTLTRGVVLQDAGGQIHHVYFPSRGMISLLAIMADGKAVETTAIGREGALGAHVGLGMLHIHTRAVVE